MQSGPSPIPVVVFLPALVFGVALVLFAVLSLRGAEDGAVRLAAGVTLPIAFLLQITALMVFFLGTSVVSGLHVFDHLE